MDKSTLQKRFVQRQEEIGNKLWNHPLGFVPVLWQSYDGKIWVEEQYTGPRPIVVCSGAPTERRSNLNDLYSAIDDAILDLEIYNHNLAAKRNASPLKNGKNRVR